MRRSPAHFGAALAGILACLLACSPLGAGAPTRSTAPGDGDGQANVRAVAPAPPVASPLDSEPIRRGAPASGVTISPTSQRMDFARIGYALGIVVALILLLGWGGRKLFAAPAGRGSRAIQVLARTPLAPRQQIVLLRVGRRLIVAADNAGQMNALSEITDPDEVAALIGQMRDDRHDFSVRSFGSMFNRASRQMSNEQERAEASETSAEESGAAAAVEEPGEEPAIDPRLRDARTDITGLMEKIRLMKEQFKGGKMQ